MTRKTGCPRHGAVYPAKGCEQCAYEREHPEYVAPSIRSEFGRSKPPTDDVTMLRGVLERARDTLRDVCECGEPERDADLLAEIAEALQATRRKDPGPGTVCQITLDGRIMVLTDDGNVVVWVQEPYKNDPVLMVLPRKNVTPLVEVKS